MSSGGFLDKPPEIFKYGLPGHNGWVRALEPYIAAGFTDREAEWALFDDLVHLESLKSVWGKQLQGRRRRRRKR